MAPAEAVVVHRELQRARRRLILGDSLHVTYLVTPALAAPRVPWHAVDRSTDDDESTTYPSFHELLRALSPLQQAVADAVGVEPRLLEQAARSRAFAVRLNRAFTASSPVLSRIVRVNDGGRELRVGYVKLSEFNSVGKRQVGEALTSMQQRGVDG
jgi:hypothetical protein